MPASRLQQLQQQLLENNRDGAFISKKEHLFYLTGLVPLHPTEREAFLIVSPHQTILYHSPFVIPVPNPKIKCVPMSPNHPLSEVLKTCWHEGDSIGVEKQNLTIQEYERCQQIVPDCTFAEIDTLLQNMRLTKEETEIAGIQKACQVTSKIMKWVQKFSRESSSFGITEQALKHAIDEQLFLHHASPAFPTIVAFDDHAASPHHIATNRKLKRNSIILVDMGAEINGYLSDMTRTWSVGTPTSLFMKIEAVVKSAYQAAKNAAKANSSGQTIDQAARNVITKAGYGKQFIHTTGHGVGLEAHELPHISIYGGEVPSNAIITIEPGIYLPGKFGYRYENTLLMAPAGAIELT